MNELSRLSKENAELRATSSALEAQRKTETEENYRRIMQLLKNNVIKPSFYFLGNSDWVDHPESVTLWTVFSDLAPELLVEISVMEAAQLLAFSLRPETLESSKKFRNQWPMPSNQVKLMLADFHALGLIMPSPKKHQVKDTNEYWSITELGKAIYSQMRIAVLERKTEKPVPAATKK